MEIGKPRTHTVKPLSDPVPRKPPEEPPEQPQEGPTVVPERASAQ
jgi:hypothetical protein